MQDKWQVLLNFSGAIQKSQPGITEASIGSLMANHLRAAPDRRGGTGRRKVGAAANNDVDLGPIPFSLFLPFPFVLRLHHVILNRVARHGGKNIHHGNETPLALHREEPREYDVLKTLLSGFE